MSDYILVLDEGTTSTRAMLFARDGMLMASAQDKLSTELAGTEMVKPAFTVISNFTARPVESPDEIRRTLESQVTGSVRWSDSMTALLEVQSAAVSASAARTAARSAAQTDSGTAPSVAASIRIAMSMPGRLAPDRSCER